MSGTHPLPPCERCGAYDIGYAGPSPRDGRPMFLCHACEHLFTHGRDGGPWASLVPSEEERRQAWDDED